MKIKDLPKSDRPRERLVAKGAENLEVTKRLAEAGKMMGVEVLDHVILAANSHFSFKEKGLLKH